MSFDEFGPNAMAKEEAIVEQDKADAEEAKAEEEPTEKMEAPTADTQTEEEAA